LEEVPAQVLEEAVQAQDLEALASEEEVSAQEEEVSAQEDAVSGKCSMPVDVSLHARTAKSSCTTHHPHHQFPTVLHRTSLSQPLTRISCSSKHPKKVQDQTPLSYLHHNSEASSMSSTNRYKSNRV